MGDILQEIRNKIKLWLQDPGHFTSLVLILVAVTAFGLGRQSVGEKEPKVEAFVETPLVEASTDTPSTYYVASKNSEVYHLPHCSGAKRISEENKVVYNTKEEAEAAGLRPAANCKGI